MASHDDSEGTAEDLWKTYTTEEASIMSSTRYTPDDRVFSDRTNNIDKSVSLGKRFPTSPIAEVTKTQTQNYSSNNCHNEGQESTEQLHSTLASGFVSSDQERVSTQHVPRNFTYNIQQLRTSNGTTLKQPVDNSQQFAHGREMGVSTGNTDQAESSKSQTTEVDVVDDLQGVSSHVEELVWQPGKLPKGTLGSSGTGSLEEIPSYVNRITSSSCDNADVDLPSTYNETYEVEPGCDRIGVEKCALSKHGTKDVINRVVDKDPSICQSSGTRIHTRSKTHVGTEFYV